jgi:hypothetical protein
MRLTPDPASDANKWIGFRLGFKVESVGVSAVFTRELVSNKTINITQLTPPLRSIK